MKEPKPILAAIMVAGMATDVISQVPHWAKGCIEYWKQYKAKPGHKAFAIKRSSTADYFYVVMRGRLNQLNRIRGSQIL